jgi:SAM-dependent methyltransferase
MLRPLLAPGASVLDVGAGRGRFVMSALEGGFDARGIEPAPRGAGELRLEREGIEEADVAKGSLDAVTMWHVLEHLDDPAGALSRIRGWLRPGGALLVGVPNLASVQAGLGGSRWYHLDVPRHRVHFTPAGIRSLLRVAGFQPVRTHHVLAEHNPFGMWQSIVNRGTQNPSYLYNLLKRNAPLRSRDLAITVLALPLAPIAGLAEVLAGVAGRGGTIAVLARRLP